MKKILTLMKKILTLICVFVLALMAMAATYSALNRRETGDRWVIGGTLAVEDSGVFDLRGLNVGIQNYMVDYNVDSVEIAVPGLKSTSAVQVQLHNTYDPTNGTAGSQILTTVPGTDKVTVYFNETLPASMPVTILSGKD